MSSSEAEGTTAATGEGVQQIPAVHSGSEVPAAAEARDALLAAIGTEAQLIVERSPGQASNALLELARAYALVISGNRHAIYSVPVAFDPVLEEPGYLVDIQVPADQAGNIVGPSAAGNSATARVVMVGGSSRIPRI